MSCVPSPMMRSSGRPFAGPSTSYSISIPFAFARMVRSLLVLVAVLEDAESRPLSAPVAHVRVLEPRRPELHGAVEQHLVADDVMHAAAIVEQPDLDAGLPRAGVGRVERHLDLRRVREGTAVPHGADGEVGRAGDDREA